MKNETERFTQRIDAQMVKRMEAIAKKTRTNLRIVAEWCLAAYLPKLEEQYGVKSDEASAEVYGDDFSLPDNPDRDGDSESSGGRNKLKMNPQKKSM